MDLPAEQAVAIPTQNNDTNYRHAENKPSSFLGVALLSALIASAIAVYLFWQNELLRLKLVEVAASPNPSPTASAESLTTWHDYVVQDLSFKYPQEWMVSTNNGISVKPRFLSSNEQYPAIIFDMRNNPNNYTVQKYEEEIVKEEQSPSIYTYGDKTATPKSFNGIEGYFLQDIACEPLGCDKFSFSLNRKIYTVTLIHDSVQEDKQYDKGMLKRTFDQILSTIKVTSSQEAQTGTVNGKLCYPSDFIPSGEVVAKNLASEEMVEQKVLKNQATYSFNLPVGTYHLRYQAHAVVDNPGAYSSGYHTECAKNENICIQGDAHELIAIKVESGAQLNNIHLCDFGNSAEQANTLDAKFEE